MGIFWGVTIVSVISVTVVDTVLFLKIKADPAKMTVPWLIAVIFITVLPIAIRADQWLKPR